MRRRLLAIVTTSALLVAALALAACGDDGGSGEAPAGDARALLRSAFTKQIPSGTLDGALHATRRGGDGPQGPFEVTVKGPFETRGDKLPRLDWEISAGGGGVTLTGGIVATGENAFVEFRGRAYELGTTLYRELERQLERRSGDARSLTALGIEPADWFRDPRAADGGEVGGDATTKVSGDLDVLAVIDDLLELSRKANPDEEVDEPTREQRRQIEESVEKARADVWVAGDGTLRRLVLDLALDVPEEAREQLDGVESGTLKLEVEITDVGAEPEIDAPDDPRPITELLGQLGFGGPFGGGSFDSGGSYAPLESQ